MKKLDKMKVKKACDVLGNITATACLVAGLVTQLKYQDTTQALCWITVGMLAGAIKVEVN